MAEWGCTLRWSHCYTIAKCVLFLTLLKSDYLVTADEDIKYSVKNCTVEDPTTWKWWYDDPVFGLNVTGNGTRCSTQCSPNCTCTLNDDTVTSNCSDGNVSVTQFRYPSDVNYLNWNNSVLQSITPGTFERFGSVLITLHLSNISRLHLQPGVFRGLSGLQWLLLDNNKLDELLPGIFNGLQGLEILWLYHNALSVIEAGVWDDLVNLEWLDLDNNALSVIEAGVWDGLVNLEWLYLNNNALSVIEAGVWDGLANLEVLYLSHNALSVIEAGVWDGLANLKVLYLSHNALSVIEAGVWDGLANLEVLSLSNNALSVIEAGVWDGLANLERLYLYNNALSVIEAGVWDGLANLEVLSLSNNALSVIEAGVWDGLANLEVLYLSHNALSVIEAGVWDGLVNLERLDLDNNALSVIEAGVWDELVNLKGLYLSNNALSVIEACVWNDLVNLEWLFLDNNALSVIEAGALGPLRNLVALRLSYNNLTSLHPDTFHNQTNLETLAINHNQLSFLPENLFQNLKKLQELDLSANMLHQIPILSQCIGLVTVNLRENPLLWISHNVFTGLNETVTLIVTKFASCCFASVDCNYKEPPSAFLTCKRLLTYDLLRIIIWFVSILGLVGNVSVLFTRLMYMPQSKKVQLLLITNLAISDFIMAIYLIILLSADLYYTDYFPSHSETWRGSVLCRIAGALSVLSSEASAFLILMMSIDRYLGIKYPYGERRLGTRLARWVVAILWLVALSISITTFVLSGTKSNVYSVSEVCVGLPISRKPFYAFKETSLWVDYIGDVNVLGA